MTQEELLEGKVIPINKPRQWTSFQAVNRVKSIIRNTYGLKKFKIGHAGTLDPLATGLLLICVGKATKRIEELQAGKKVYTGTIVLGATTPCYDLERPIDRHYPYQHITKELLNETRVQFIGDIQQVPPIFSAVKIGGQRAYQYARIHANSEKEISYNSSAPEETPSPAPKSVQISEFTITAFRPGKHIENWNEFVSAEIDNSETPTHHLYNHPLGSVPDHLPQLDFRICCGKGTYIRSIARDMGLAMDSGAFLSALCREQIGDYCLNDALPLDKVSDFFTD